MGSAISGPIGEAIAPRIAPNPALWATQVNCEAPPFAQVNRGACPRAPTEGGGRCAFRALSF